MGGVQSANVDRPTPPNPPTACETNIPLIQQELLKADEFKERFYVKLNTIERVDISGSLTRCKAGLFLTNITSGVTTQETRIISLLEENGRTIVKSIVADTSGTTTTDVNPYYTPAQVEKYYNDLQSYNASWTAFRWKTEDTYAPPMPQWRDPIFEKNVEIYNKLFRSVLGKETSNPVNIQAIETASGSVPGSTVVNNYYQKYLSPLPADPAPPSPRMLTVPQMMQPAATGGSNNSASLPPVSQDATVSNMQAQAKNMDSYNAFLGPGSPDYDPPQSGDSYETVLIKYNKSYDIATSKNVTASGMDSAGSAVPSTNRRLINRINNSVANYRVPDPILPTTGIVKAARYKSYNFNEREQYLIDYSPVTGPNRDLLVKNFCNSLGYEVYSDKLPGCEPGDCCAPMPTAPMYNKEAVAAARAAARAASASKTEGFTASASANANSKCTGGISLAGRTVTVSVPRPPITLNPSQAMFAYRTTRPTDPTPACAARSTNPSVDVESIKGLYDKLRPSLIKELQQSLKGNKIFELRCPADFT